MAPTWNTEKNTSICFAPNSHESAKDKQLLNVRLVEELDQTLTDIAKRKNYLHEYWYNLKYYVKLLHAAYRLLHKILTIYGNASMATKLNCHHLVYGLIPIQENLKLFTKLVNFVSIQLAYIKFMVKFSLDVPVQDKMIFLLYSLVKFFDHVIWLNDVTGKYKMNGLPIKMEFI